VNIVFLFVLNHYFLLVFSQNIWVFGYGSMMGQNHQPSNTFLPVRVSGVTRAFDTPGYLEVESGSGYLNLLWQAASIHTGLHWNASGSTNGLLFNVTSNELATLDAAELGAEGNSRQNLSTSQITVLFSQGNVIGANDQIYTYMLADNLRVPGPNASLKIIQSYVDEIIHSCIDVDTLYNTSTAFRDEFVANTFGWDTTNWVNDRLFPRNPSLFQPLVNQIDTALFKVLGNSLSSVTLDFVKDPYMTVVSNTLQNTASNVATLQALVSLYNSSLDRRVSSLESQIIVVKEEAKFLMIIVISFLVVLAVVIIGICVYLYKNANSVQEWVQENIPLTVVKTYGTS